MKEIGALIWALLQVVGFFLSILLVQLPFYVVRHVMRWYRLPRWKRDAINTESRLATEYGWQQVEALIRAELAMHNLQDTPENRVKLNSTRIRRRK
jgi:hypothetical protein